MGYKLLVFANTAKVNVDSNYSFKVVTRVARKGMAGAILRFGDYYFGVSSIHMNDIKNNSESRKNSQTAAAETLGAWEYVIEAVREAAAQQGLARIDWFFTGDHNPRSLFLIKSP